VTAKQVTGIDGNKKGPTVTDTNKHMLQYKTNTYLNRIAKARSSLCTMHPPQKKRERE
jgi:hypothetical protein